MNRKREIILLSMLFLAACMRSPASSFSSTTPTNATAATLNPTNSPRAIESTTETQFIRRDTPTPEFIATTTQAVVTPTFDVSSIISKTASVPAKCPLSANVSLPDLSIDPDNYSFMFSPREAKVLDYLNQGGNPSNLIAYLRQTWGDDGLYMKNEAVKDLTGDGIPEILIMPSELYIFGCQNHEYQILMTKINESVSMNFIGLQLAGIQDMNLNNIPEIVLANFGCGGMSSGQCLDVFVYEWDGQNFASLIPKWEGYDVGVAMIGGRLHDFRPDVKIQDIDHNGTQELILMGDIPSSWYDEYYSAAPWREKIDTYIWNGEYFVLLKTEFSAPVYRYQAVQDGDRAMVRLEYEKALAFYQAAIFDSSLLGWSPAHKDRFKALHQFAWDPAYWGTPTPVVPPDDSEEYFHLAAYARYRIMLLHVLQDHMPEAETVYRTLQENFPEGKDGHAFAQIATAFWEAYQQSQNIQESCGAAIAVATDHERVLSFLGGEHHNFMQDVMYLPEDICSFD